MEGGEGDLRVAECLRLEDAFVDEDLFVNASVSNYNSNCLHKPTMVAVAAVLTPALNQNLLLSRARSGARGTVSRDSSARNAFSSAST